MTNLDARLVYENAKNALRKAFPDVPNIAEICKLTQSTLRLEQPIKAGNTLLRFPVLVNEGRFSETEIRLLQQDSAVVYSIGAFLAVGTTTDKKLYSYPSLEAFTTAGTAAATQALYNGSMSITVNNDVLVPSWDIFKHLNVPQSQYHAAADDGQTPPVPIYPGQQDEIRGSWDGFYPMEPNVVLIGSKNNVIEIKVPNGITTVQADSKVVLIMRTILAQNSTVVS